MTEVNRAPTPTSCELCESTSIVVFHVSARTGEEIGRCQSCRLVMVLNPLPDETIRELYNSTEGYKTYVEAQRVDGLRRRHQATIRRLSDLLPQAGAGCTIFDVGAGAGEFLALARDAGFAVAGNEISKPAAEECFRRHDISLTSTDLNDEPGANRFDAITMWCVLAHVREPRRLLADAFRLLKPHGILYFHTPRWCTIDIVGRAAVRVSGGRLFQVTERRINAAHMRLYEERNLRRLVSSVGFDVLALAAVSGYSLRSASYVDSLGIPSALVKPIALALDGLIERDLCIRNTLEVYAGKPN